MLFYGTQSEGCCDRLYVYESEVDGAFVPDADTGGYDDPGFSGTLTSSGSTMYLRWHSDSSIVFPGWTVGGTTIMYC